MKPKRIQIKRVKGFKLPTNTKCVNRGTKYGNPYKVVKRQYDYCIVTKNSIYFDENTCRTLKEANEKAIELFKEYLNDFKINEIVADLKGKNLACFCSLDVPCHADYLLEIANS